MKPLTFLPLVAAIALSSPSRAEKLDLTTMKCKQFLEISKENASVITTWLVGYYTEVDEGEVIDLVKLKETNQKLSAFCAQHPNFGLTGAAEGLLSK